MVEIDTESVTYLNRKYPELQKNTLNEDFLKMDLSKPLMAKPLALLETSLTTFRAKSYSKPWSTVNTFLFLRHVQKEVAQRICEKPGTKAYGILSVLCQTYYHAQYHFNVSPTVFSPHQK